MHSDKPAPVDEGVYVQYSTSAAGAFQSESSAIPSSLASIVRDATLFYEELPLGQLRQPGLKPGSIWARDDFDEPLPDEFWATNE